ncbi:HNH endonuclease signature motif containing protein [Arthrobacter sp.]|uniref:HNH endonuclease signature motif containing protein n=1 Tax=Arthrobacter sp. TaxID=1667 RepID=UPI0025865DE5|nr:HNH endonuclease signature motif containing protein [Arthrobacter sp.]
MEATARVPGRTGTPTGTGTAGGHIHQLITLAAALTAAATAASTAASESAAATAAGGPGAPSDPVVPAPLGVSLESLGDAELIAWGRTVEQLGRYVQALQVQAAGTIATRTHEGRYLREGHKSPADVLTDALLLSRAEAGRRLNLAQHFLPATDPLTTVTTPCDQPVLATAFFTGTTTAEQALTASHYAADAAHLAHAGRTTAEKARELETTMTTHAQTQNPDFLRRIGTRVINIIDPDGDKPTEGELIAKQGIRFHRAYRGLIKITGHATIAQYESIMAYIGHSTNPAPHKDINTINPNTTGNNRDRNGSGSGTGGNNADGNGNGNGSSTGTGGNNGNGNGSGSSDILPGQMNLMDLLHAATATGTAPTPATPTPPPAQPPGPAQLPGRAQPPAPASPAPGAAADNSWPPPQGPAPDWAQPATTTANDGKAATTDGDTTDGDTGGTVPGNNDAATDDAATDGASTDGAAQDGEATSDGKNAGFSFIFPAPPPPAGLGWQPASDDTRTNSNNAGWIFPDSPPPAGIGWQPQPAATTTHGTGTPNATATTHGTGSTGSNEDSGARGISPDSSGVGRTDNAAGTDDVGGEGGAQFWATPGLDPAERGGPDGSGTEPPWPHLVHGIQVPEPGSDIDLPGLDPIDPNNTDPAVADKRTHAQKLLDGMIDCLHLAARTELLPLNGGMKPQLIISTTEADLQANRSQGKGGGIAFLPYTGPSNLSLFDTKLCDADVTTMILGDGQKILNVGRTQRLFTPTQRKLLIARDIGCTFPHCTRPARWCDAHHIIPWQDGGETSIENGALACEYHHSLIHQGHWSVRLLNGIPLYTPTHGTDPNRRDLRNPYHHGLTLPAH